MGFASIESFLENHIEGFFNKKFDSDLEFPEIEKKLQREIERCRSKVRRGGIPICLKVIIDACLLHA